MIMVIWLNLLMCAWLFNSRPFEKAKMNFFECMNEFINLSVSLMLLVQNNNTSGDDLY